MAYKFQLGDFIASGSLTAKQGSVYASGSLVDLALRDDAGFRRFDVDYNGGNIRMRLKNSSDVTRAFMSQGATSVSGAADAQFGGAIIVGNSAYGINANGAVTGSSISGSSNLQVGGTVRFDGVADAAADVAADSFYFLDGDNLMKRETMADYATTIAGDALAASSGVLAVAVDDSSIEISADALRIKATGVTDAMLNDDVATGLAGDGLAASSGVLSVGVSGAVHVTSDKVAISGSIAGAALSYAGGVDSISSLALDISELSDAAVASGDKFLMLDSDGSTQQLESIDDISTFQAGDGLAASSGVLSVGVDNSSIEISGDALQVKAAGITDAMLNDDVASGLAGDGLYAVGGVMHVSGGHFGGLDVDTNSVFITGSKVDVISVTPAADNLFYIGSDGTVRQDSLVNYAAALGNKSNGGLGASGGQLELDLSDLTAAAIASGDTFAFYDTDGSGTRKESVDDLATLFAGDGLTAASAVLAVQVSGAMRISSDKVAISGSIAGNGLGYLGGVDSISSLEVQVDDSTIEIASDSLQLKDDGVTGAKLAPAVAGNGLAQDGSGNLDLDLFELTAAAVDVANDSIAIIDSDDSNSSKKESIADLVSAMAGAGLTATNGVLSTDAAATPVAVGDADATLTEGTTYGSATLTANRTWSLPAAPTAGDMVRVKAPTDLGGFDLIVAKQGLHTIDGVNELRLQSDNAAVTLIYVATNLWKIV